MGGYSSFFFFADMLLLVVLFLVCVLVERLLNAGVKLFVMDAGGANAVIIMRLVLNKDFAATRNKAVEYRWTFELSIDLICRYFKQFYVLWAHCLWAHCLLVQYGTLACLMQ
jgi:hypothetical protein